MVLATRFNHLLSEIKFRIKNKLRNKLVLFYIFSIYFLNLLQVTTLLLLKLDRFK